MNNDTTRRFPRTMNEAFPGHDAGWMSPRYRRPVTHRIADVLLACSIGIGLAMAAAHWWSM